MKQEKIPTYIQEIPGKPNQEQKENVKQKMIAEFQYFFSDIEETLRPMTCIPAEIKIRISTTRKLAYAFRDETIKGLDTMVQQGVIKLVGQSSGRIWICVDLTKLNKYVKRPIHPETNQNEVVSDVPPGQKYFTRLDALKGCWQITLSENS